MENTGAKYSHEYRKTKHLLSITKMHTDLNISLNKTVSTFPTKLSSTLKANFGKKKYTQYISGDLNSKCTHTFAYVIIKKNHKKKKA
jgi:hypothetical protein